MMKVFVCFVAVLVVVLGVTACETSVYDLGKTGNVTLGQLGFENMNLIPPVLPAQYSPFYLYYHRDVTNYRIIQSTNTRFKIVVAPDLVWTKYWINDVRVKMETNSIGYPTYTDVTHLLSNSPDGKTFAVRTLAEDGSAKKYTITILGSEYDAAVSSIDLSAGSVYPKFIEGNAPYYADGYNGTNAYYAVADDSFSVTVRPVQTNTRVTIGNTAVSNQVAPASGVNVPITLLPTQKDGAWYDFPVFVVSQNGAMTNKKLLRLAYIAVVDDSRLTDLKLNNDAQSLSADFYFGKYEYSAIFDDVNTVAITMTKASATSKVYVDTGAGYGAEVGAGQKTFTTDALPVKMSGVINLKVVSENAVNTTIYSIKTMVFTSTPYDFDGGIKKYLEAVKLQGEYTPPTPLEGILTIRDYYGYNDAYYCFYVQDKNAGLYVFLSLMGNPNRLDMKYKVGHRIKFIASKSKNYYGQMEAVEFTSMTFADGGSDPATQTLYPVYAMPAPDFYNNSYQGKIVRVKNTVGLEINDKKVGYFANNTPFHINDPSVYARILPKLQVGMGGTFYGPVLWAWGMNQMEFVNEDYCIFDKK